MAPFHVACARVISLVGSERRTAFFAQESAAQFTVFDACDGRDPDVFARFDHESAGRHWGAPSSPAPVGCALSHTAVITEFAAAEGGDDDWLLVAEDDVVFRPEAAEVVNAILTRPPAEHVIVLADSWSRHPRGDLRRALATESQISLLGRSIRVAGEHYRVGRFAGPAWCAALYLVSRRGARRLAEAVRRQPHSAPWWLADDWHLLRDLADLDIALARPSLVGFVGGSTISSTRDEPTAPGVTGRLDRIRVALAVRSRVRAGRLAVRATREDVRCRASQR